MAGLEENTYFTECSEMEDRSLRLHHSLGTAIHSLFKNVLFDEVAPMFSVPVVVD